MSEKAKKTDQKQAAQKTTAPTGSGPQGEITDQTYGIPMPPGTSLGDIPRTSNADLARQRAAMATQRQSGNQAVMRFVQRQPAPAPAGGSGAGKGGNTFPWEGVTLSTDPAATRIALEDVVAKKGLKGGQEFVGSFSSAIAGLAARQGASGAGSGPSGPGQDASSDDLPVMEAIKPVLVSEFGSLKLSVEQFLKDFEEQAKGTVYTMLMESENKLYKEAERYGLTGGPGSLTPFEVSTAATDNEENKQMAAAAGQMMALSNEVDKLIVERTKFYVNAGDNQLKILLDRSKVDELTTQINEKEEKINALTGQFPMLAAYKQADKRGQLEAMSKGGSEAAATVGPLIKKELDNIKLVKGGLDNDKLKIWSLPKVIQGTKGKMALGPTTMGSKVVDEHAGQVQSDQDLVNFAIGALTIAVGLIASIPTGGAGGAAVAAGASALSAGISAYQVASALQEYQLAEAMNATDPDKAKAISSEEPSLFWLALDIVGMIADIHGAFAAFKALAPEVKTVLSITEDFTDVEGSLKSFRETCEKAKVPSLYERVVSRIRSVLDKNSGTLNDLKKVAQERYAALSPKQKEDMLKAGVSEEKFIEQMASNASRDIVISGAEGVRRTEFVMELMQPGNPWISSVLSGDTATMDRLLKQHGSWQQLMSQLTAGTPEMKSAAVQLAKRRAELLSEIEAKFFAKQAPGASAEAVSDVDLISDGAKGAEDAGAMMIAAEKFVKDRYGEGWSEALRMNFYTMAERLYMYSREMKGMSGQARAGLLADLSKQTDMYTVAKMMEYAKGDAAAMKRAQDYAKTLGVDVNSPEIQKLLNLTHSPEARLKERNRLLEKADELMKRYRAIENSGSPQERMELAREITENQMRANFFTEEAYIGPGAAKMVVSQIDVVGFEAKMAVTSQLSMVAHEVAKYGGKVEIAMREYEIYKYMNRFAGAARKAGSSNPKLAYFENLSAFIYKTERSGASKHAHLADIPGKSTPMKGTPYLSENAPRIGEVSDDYLKSVYSDFNAFSHEIMREMDMITSQNSGAWTQFNIPRPNPGTYDAAKGEWKM